MLAVDGVAAVLNDVRARIEAAGGRDVTIRAVTKGFSVDRWPAAHAAGSEAVGESYAQGALAKRAGWAERDEAVAPPALHFVGRLQTNKIRSLAGSVALWQSVDRDAVVDELARRDPGAAVLI